MNFLDLARVLRVAADECEQIFKEDRQDRRGWVEQSTSPLGRKRHAVCVRKRVAMSRHGAAILGRRFLLSQAALAEELDELSKNYRFKPCGNPKGDESYSRCSKCRAPKQVTVAGSGGVGSISINKTRVRILQEVADQFVRMTPEGFGRWLMSEIKEAKAFKPIGVNS